jgi:hypothetical protein
MCSGRLPRRAPFLGFRARGRIAILNRSDKDRPIEDSGPAGKDLNRPETPLYPTKTQHKTNALSIPSKKWTQKDTTS